MVYDINDNNTSSTWQYDTWTAGGTSDIDIKQWGNYAVATHFVCPNCLRIIPMMKAFLADANDDKRAMYFCCEKCSKDFDESKSVPMEI